MESLGKIFGSNDRVKIMRLFLFNDLVTFDIDDIVKRTKTKKAETQKELKMLTSIGFLRTKNFIKKIPKKTSKKDIKPEFKRIKKQGWILDKKFQLAEDLRVLLLDSELVKEKDIVQRIRKSGTIKLLVLSGIFTQDANRKIDLLIVGDNLKKDILVKQISILESEIGRELAYAIFDQTEFEYRIRMYDKLIRDVVENKHIRLINSIIK